MIRADTHSRDEATLHDTTQHATLLTDSSRWCWSLANRTTIDVLFSHRQTATVGGSELSSSFQSAAGEGLSTSGACGSRSLVHRISCTSRTVHSSLRLSCTRGAFEGSALIPQACLCRSRCVSKSSTQLRPSKPPLRRLAVCWR